MKRLVYLFAVIPCLYAHSASAAPPAAPYLSAPELLEVCATSLPKQLECKEDFCSAMVDLRKRHQARFAAVDRAEMVKMCLSEIAVDGAGDFSARKERCAAWSKDRPTPQVLRSDAEAAAACFQKPTCQERIACWAPFTEKQLATAPKK
jgi:hypothetical protein